MRRWLGMTLVLGLWACLPPREAGGESSLPLLYDDEPADHGVKEELAWATYRQRFEPEALLVQASEACREEGWESAEEAAFQLIDQYPDSPEAVRALWILGRAAAELSELDRAERAMLAALCPEAAPSPVLSGSMPPFPSARTTCTPGPSAPEDLGEAWSLLLGVEARLGHPDATAAASERVIAASAPGSELRSSARVQVITQAMWAGDRERVFTEAATLVEEGGSPLDVELAVGALANAIAEDDWDRDGRKDSLSGLSRRSVARWLATSPSSAPLVLREAATTSIRNRRCGEARRIHARLARLQDGAEAARAIAAEVRSCVGR